MNHMSKLTSLARVRQMCGASAVKLLVLIPAALVLLLILVVGFYEGRKAYWDYRVREMCAKDGGMKVYQHVAIPGRYVDTDGFIRIPSEPKNRAEPLHFEAKADDLFSYSLETEQIKEGDLTVYRYHITVIRRADSTLLGESVIYGRGGGDFPSFAYPSRFDCPENQGESQLISAIFAKNKIQ